MINIISQGGKTSYKIEDYIADTLADLADLPTDFSDVAPGSTCLVIETSQVFMLNSEGEWKEI